MQHAACGKNAGSMTLLLYISPRFPRNFFFFGGGVVLSPLEEGKETLHRWCDRRLFLVWGGRHGVDLSRLVLVCWRVGGRGRGLGGVFGRTPPRDPMLPTAFCG